MGHKVLIPNLIVLFFSWLIDNYSQYIYMDKKVLKQYWLTKASYLYQAFLHLSLGIGLKKNKITLYFYV